MCAADTPPEYQPPGFIDGAGSYSILKSLNFDRFGVFNTGYHKFTAFGDKQVVSYSTVTYIRKEMIDVSTSH